MGKGYIIKNLTDGGGLEEHDYGARIYDLQIRRWFTIDLKADKRLMVFREQAQHLLHKNNSNEICFRY
jgi:hypothetical protein